MNEQKPPCDTDTCTLGTLPVVPNFVYPRLTIRNAAKHMRRNQKVLLVSGDVVKFKKTKTYREGRPIILV